VGFHNYEDVLIRVRGDLFVVGANESGKTTLLDAVHLVLSGEQDLDWNAAASLAGPRRSGRTLQGIILRANMAGQSTRPGGSICYAVVELEPVESNGGAVSLVFGASAMDMHTQVQKWGVVVMRRADDLPLTEKQSDGIQRILDRDEFESRLSHRIHKGPRGLGDYRTTVASKLFAGREQFDEVTRLWRTAKSYREVASTARNIGEVFRQVLPAPDPEPFQKIAKGFRDIAGIESELQELSRDVEALHKLRELLEGTREARETFRRYVFVREYRRARDHEAQLQIMLSRRDLANAHVDELRRGISQNEEQCSLIKERLAILRESDDYKLLAGLEAKEQELLRSDGRLVDLRVKLQNERSRHESLRAEHERKHESAGLALARTRAALELICGKLGDEVPGLAFDTRALLSILPTRVEEALDAEAIESVTELLRAKLSEADLQTNQRVSAVERRLEQLEKELDGASRQLRRIEQFDDLVPPLPRLDEVLLHLREKGIHHSLLFQHLEWRGAATPELQSAVEAAIGLSRLSTIVVSPEQTESARRVVLELGEGLHILDSEEVDLSSPSENFEGSRLLDLLAISEPRVRSHFEGTLAAVVLRREMPVDGIDAEWFAADGTGGERGARWRLGLEEPRWVGERRRQTIRQRDQERLQQSVKTLREQLETLKTDGGRLQSILKQVQVSRSSLDALALPWSISQPFKEWRHVAESASELSRRIEELTKELDEGVRHRDELSQLIAEMRSQVQGTDAEAAKQQVDQLEARKKALDTELVDLRADCQTTQKELAGLDEKIASYQSEAIEVQRLLGVARTSLASILTAERAGALEHYVFETKRGSQLKAEKFEDNIADAREREIELKTKLAGADGVLNDKLAIRYGFRLDDDEGLMAIRDRGDLELDSILELRRDQERQLKESLNEKTRELFETIFARDLTERLRADLLQVRRTVIEINRKLEPLVFGHCRFQLSPRPITEYRPLVELIERQAALDTEHREALRYYLQDRRDQLLDEGEVAPFLDYRNWFDYGFRLEHVKSTSGESLGSEDMVRGSVGAQTTHNYLLLLAQASLLFDRCNASLRLLMLDDAFYGLDIQRKELLLRCGKQLGLDFVIATPDLDGTIQEQAGDSTTLLVESDGQGGISILPFEWEQTPLQQELFAEPRPDAILGVKESAT